MKVLVFSDVHGNLESLKAILNIIDNNNYDKVIFLGDLVDFGPNPNECIDLLKKHKDIIYLYGNHELYLSGNIKMDKIKECFVKWTKDRLSKENLNFVLNNNKLYYSIKHNGKLLMFKHYFTKKNYKNYPFKNIHDNYEPVKDCDYLFLGHDHDNKEFKLNTTNVYIIGSTGTKKDIYYYTIDLNDDINIEKHILKYNYDDFYNKLKNVDYIEKKHIFKHIYDIDI